MKLTLCIQLLDKSILRNILDSVDADQTILVGDASFGSTAEKFKVDFFEGDQSDDSLNKAIKKAKGDWVLIVKDKDVLEGDYSKLLDQVKYDAYTVTRDLDGEKTKEARLFRNKIGLKFIDGSLDKSIEENFSSVGDSELVLKDHTNTFKELTKEHDEYMELYQKGTDCILSGRTDEAIELLSKANRLQPLCIEASAQLGIAYSQNGEYDKALKCFTTALKVPPEQAIVYYEKNVYSNIFANIGLLMTRKENYDKAITAFEKAIALGHPDKEKLQERIDQLKQASEDKVRMDYCLTIGNKLD